MTTISRIFTENGTTYIDVPQSSGMFVVRHGPALTTAVAVSSAGVTMSNLSVPGTATFSGNVSVGTSAANTFTNNAGVISSPNIPAVLAHVSAEVTNVTGDGTNYTVIFDTERKDQGGNYNNSTGVFTAPTTGVYSVSVWIQFRGATSNNTRGFIALVTSNKTYTAESNPFVDLNGDGRSTISIALPAVDMDASDTLSVTLNVSAIDKGIDVQVASYLSIVQVA